MYPDHIRRLCIRTHTATDGHTVSILSIPYAFDLYNRNKHMRMYVHMFVARMSIYMPVHG